MTSLLSRTFKSLWFLKLHFLQSCNPFYTQTFPNVIKGMELIGFHTWFWQTGQLQYINMVLFVRSSFVSIKWSNGSLIRIPYDPTRWCRRLVCPCRRWTFVVVVFIPRLGGGSLWGMRLKDIKLVMLLLSFLPLI